MKPILVYDDKCGPCTAFASGGKRDDRAITLGYSTEEAKRLMEAQFGKEYGFTLMLFKDPEAHWGQVAAREYVHLGYMKRGYLSPLRKLTEWVYPYVVQTLNVLLHRERLPEPPRIEGEEVKRGGSRPLTQEAYEIMKQISGKYGDEETP